MEAEWWKANFQKARCMCIPGLKPRQPINSAGILKTGFYKPTNQGQPPLWKPANQEGTHCTNHASDCQPINNRFIRWRHARASVPSTAGDVRSSLCCGDAERAGPQVCVFISDTDGWSRCWTKAVTKKLLENRLRWVTGANRDWPENHPRDVVRWQVRWN